ncbi:hypothetical protein [uncultured Herbaspirillum sp.]|uniref:hypothetical protein n=1 Tax=uncultured Herbaspirillum sp. TaxID=160236 RepID=UPI00258E7437|nr:hypothetical protein [uncultured Herbaspirillum sp.]
MKLRNSIAEDKYRESLIEGRRYFLESENGKKVLKRIEEIYGKVKSIYVLSHVPEQGGEDFYRVLVDGDKVISCDLQCDGAELSVCTIEGRPVKDYEDGLKGKMERIQLLVAFDLLEKIPQLPESGT